MFPLWHSDIFSKFKDMIAIEHILYFGIASESYHFVKRRLSEGERYHGITWWLFLRVMRFPFSFPLQHLNYILEVFASESQEKNMFLRSTLSHFFTSSKYIHIYTHNRTHTQSYTHTLYDDALVDVLFYYYL